MILYSVFIISLSSLMYEILLARYFSIAQWNHLSFMVISIVLFGFSLGGVFLYLLSVQKPGFEKTLIHRKWILFFLLCFSIFSVGSYITVNFLPLDYFRIPFEGIQIIYLLLTFLLLSLPFFSAGIILAAAYTNYPEKSGIIYFSSMTGSACGAVLPLFILPFAGVGGSILISSIASLTPFLFLRVKKKLLNSAAIVVLSLLFVLLFYGNKITEVNPSPYKWLSQLLQFPHTLVTKTEHSIREQTDTVKSPYIRFAPGMSLSYTGSLPEQTSIITDGDLQTVLYNEKSIYNFKFAEYSLPYSGYILKQNPENILIIQKGGGSAICCAFLSKAEKIILLEESPQISQAVKDTYKNCSLTVENDYARSYLAQTDLYFDVIHLEDWGSSIPGMESLNQQYLLTIEAFIQYFSRLSSDGLFIVSRKTIIPPSDSLRLFNTAFNALLKSGITLPLNHLVLLRNWDTYTLIISRQPFSKNNINTILDFTESMSFDTIYYPGISVQNANKYNIFKEPYYFNEINKLCNSLQKNGDNYISNYYLNIDPVKDNDPFYSRFLKWRKIKELYGATGSRAYSLIISGEILVWVVLIFSILLAAGFLLLPIKVFSKFKNPINPFIISYFFLLGAGFMFCELSFIKEYTFLTGNPVVSFTIVLTSMLIFSGIGGYLSERFTKISITKVLSWVIVILFLTAFTLNIFTHALINYPVAVRYIFLVLFIIPASVAIGIPFPLGMKKLPNSTGERSLCWTVNGSASVVSSIAAIPIAMDLGIVSVMLFAGISYAFALLFLFYLQNQSK